MTSFGPDDQDLHDPHGKHIKTSRGTKWNRRMEAHIELHVRVGASNWRVTEDRADRWDLGTHVPRQLRTPLAES